MPGKISEKQQLILDYIKEEILKKGYPPTVREICEKVGLRSTSSVHSHLATLEENGYIRRDPTKPRAIEIIDDEFGLARREMSNIPVVGRVAAGEPLLAVENIEDYFALPTEFLPNNETFILKIHGESMINVGFYENDYIIVERTSAVSNGDIVVALIDDSVTVKTFYKENGGIIFPNPNAPTALYMELDKVEDIIRHNQDSVVIIDEAYIDFGGKSAIDFVNKYDNVIVVQTYSKSRSMAGVRIGFAFGSPELIKALNDVKFSFNSYTMNAYSLICGVAAMEDEDYFNAGVNKIINTRESAKSKLKELGFSFPDSKANFIFAKHESVPAKVIFDKLKQRGIYVRYFNKEKIDNYLRISIGTDAQMQALYAALKEIVNA